MNRKVVFVFLILALLSTALQGSATGTDDGGCTEVWDTCRTTFNYQNVLANLAREHNPKVEVPDTLPLKIDVSHLNSKTCVTRTDDGATFYGYRSARRNGTSDVIGLYNTGGHFCGIQARFPQHEILTGKNAFRYDLVPMFQSETFQKVKYFVLTAYTCDPETICKEDGPIHQSTASQAEDRLVFQNGPDPTPAYLLNIPKRRQDAFKIGFGDDNCVLGMGQHSFYRVDSWTPTNCTQVFPVFLLQNKCGYLIGFAFFWVGNSNSAFLDPPTRIGLGGLLGGRAPQCSLDLVDASKGGGGVSSIHVWFTKRTPFCGPNLTTAEVRAALPQLLWLT